MMKTCSVIFCLLSSLVLAKASPEEFVSRLSELGSQVENGSEGDMEIKVSMIDLSFNLDTQEKPVLVVIRNRQSSAIKYFLDEIVSDAETRAKLKSMIDQMDSVQLYVFGTREDDSDYEVSNWYLMGAYDSKTVVLTHERVFT